MQPRKHVAGEASGAFVKFLIGAVLFFVLVPKLLQCAQEAPQRLSDAASKAADAAMGSIEDAADSAVRSTVQEAKNSVCGVPLIGEPCTADDSTAAESKQAPRCMAVDEAARQGLSEARKKTRCAAAYGQQQEFGGDVFSYQKGQCFDATDPVPLAATSGVTSWAVPKSHPDAQSVGHYHSHPLDRPGYFSLVDLCNYVAHQEPFVGYVVGTSFNELPGFLGGAHYGGYDREVRKFVPNGHHFKSDSVFASCVSKDAPSTGLIDWTMKILRAVSSTCAVLERKYDVNGVDVGKVTQLVDVPADDSLDGCAPPSVAAVQAISAGAPSVDALQALLGRCTAQ